MKLPALMCCLGLAISCATTKSRTANEIYEEHVEKMDQERQAESENYERCEKFAPQNLRYDYLQPSVEERQKHGAAFDPSDGIPSSPSKLFERFKAAESDFQKMESNGCAHQRNEYDKDLGTTFAKEWAFQRKREANRQTALKTLRDANAKADAEDEKEREQWKSEMRTAAKRKGYKEVLFDVGLIKVIDSLLEGKLAITDLKNVVIELDESTDEGFVALQVLGKGRALYTADEVDIVVMLKNYDKQILEGSSLTSLDTSYFTIKGTTRYKTSVGSRQAVVIVPAL